MSDPVSDRMQAMRIAETSMPWYVQPPDNLEPRGETLSEVLDWWLACRADTFDVGMGQIRYCITDADAANLAAHLEKWLAARDA